MASSCPTEYSECQAFHHYLEMKGIPHTHIGNESQLGGRAGIIRGARLKAIGQSKGFPDYLLVVNGQLVAIEMKRQKGGHTSPEQKEWLGTLTDCGVKCFVCRGATQAIETVEKLLANLRSAGVVDQ